MPRLGFGEFVVDIDAIELTGPNGVRRIEPQVFDVLRYLVEQRGRMVTKEELLDNVWGDRFVSESALTTRIKQARRALDDDGSTQWAIKTVHGRGYRFLPEVQILDTDPVPQPSGATADQPQTLPDALRADARQLFCGRTNELAACGEVLAEASDSSPFGWIWLLGEPGIGKTRLAAEVARHAQAIGHRVAFGRNSEDLRVPYQPFIEVIRPAPGDDLGALAPLLPSAASSDAAANGHAGTTDESAVDREILRFRLFEAIADWLGRRSSDAPLTMIIDDAHWAADSTLQLLSHLQRRAEGGPVTFVLTARDTAPDANPRILDLLATGQGSPRTSVLRLEGLSDGDAQRLVGDDLDLGEIMRQTAGNPLFLQAVNPADGSVDMQRAVHRRLASLDDRVQESLRLVSVLGLEFELKVAAAANARDELELLDDLEEAVAARLLDDVGPDRFRFTHALVRSTLRDELSSARRGRMHERIAASIDTVFGDDPGHLPELAFHTSEAALVDPSLRPLAVQRLRDAAHESMAQYSFDEAADLLRRARGLVDVSDTVSLGRLALDQGIAETRAGQNMIAAHTFEDAVAAARTSGDALLLVESAIRYEDASWRPGLSGEVALRLLDEATSSLDTAVRAGLDGHDAAVLRARISVGRFRSLAMSGRRSEVGQAFAEARRLAADLGSPDIEANVLSVYLGQVMFYEGPSDTEAMIGRLAELEPDIIDGDVALHAIHDRILHATLTGRFEHRAGLVRSLVELQERSHSSFWRFIRVNQEAMEAFYRGDLEMSEALAEQCLQLADELPEEDGGGTYGLRMFLIRREQDRLAPMAPMIRQILARTDGDPLWTPGLGLLLVETGAMEEAADALEPVKEAGFDLPMDAMWSTVMVLLIEAMVQLGDTEACAVLRDRFRVLAGSNVTTGSGLLCFGRAERYLGMLSLTLGDYDTAEAQLGAALEADDAGGSVLWSNESRLWLARTRRAQGHGAEADAMAQVVVEQAAAAGLHRLRRLGAADALG